VRSCLKTFAKSSWRDRRNGIRRSYSHRLNTSAQLRRLTKSILRMLIQSLEKVGKLFPRIGLVRYANAGSDKYCARARPENGQGVSVLIMNTRWKRTRPSSRSGGVFFLIIGTLVALLGLYRYWYRPHSQRDQSIRFPYLGMADYRACIISSQPHAPHEIDFETASRCAIANDSYRPAEAAFTAFRSKVKPFFDTFN
jgi:hypothetical protein